MFAQIHSSTCHIQCGLIRDFHGFPLARYKSYLFSCTFKYNRLCLLTACKSSVIKIVLTIIMKSFLLCFFIFIFFLALTFHLLFPDCLTCIIGSDHDNSFGPWIPLGHLHLRSPLNSVRLESKTLSWPFEEAIPVNLSIMDEVLKHLN